MIAESGAPTYRLPVGAVCREEGEERALVDYLQHAVLFGNGEVLVRCMHERGVVADVCARLDQRERRSGRRFSQAQAPAQDAVYVIIALGRRQQDFANIKDCGADRSRAIPRWRRGSRLRLGSWVRPVIKWGLAHAT